jgi:ribosomal protein S4
MPPAIPDARLGTLGPHLLYAVLVTLGLAANHRHAVALIRAGDVLVNGRPATLDKLTVRPDPPVVVQVGERFVRLLNAEN